MLGASELIVIVTVVVPVPLAFVAVIVYVVAEEVTVGVPDITPVVVLKDKPAGNAVLME